MVDFNLKNYNVLDFSMNILINDVNIDLYKDINLCGISFDGKKIQFKFYFLDKSMFSTLDIIFEDLVSIDMKYQTTDLQYYGAMIGFSRGNSALEDYKNFLLFGLNFTEGQSIDIVSKEGSIYLL